jgi:23S rRNA pseudouridine1911/1915/1917 synthase
MAIGSHGKIAKTIVIPLKYYKNKDQTLIEIEILTGRQHQIRVHLNSIGHTIVGDPIYGVSKLVANNYLNKNLTKKQRIEFTGNNRLMLHAHYLAFKYNNLNYKIFSKQHFLSN